MRQYSIDTVNIITVYIVIMVYCRQVHTLAEARTAALTRALVRAQFVRDATEARGWVANKMKKLEADQGQGMIIYHHV